jgi:hypothetical protein
MKATSYPLEDNRGIFALGIELFRAATSPSPVPDSSTKRRNWFERLERWAASARQRDLERYLAQSTDVFDLERRLTAFGRHPYF